MTEVGGLSTKRAQVRVPVGAKFSDGIYKYLPHSSLSYVIIMSLIVVSVCIN